MEALEKKGIFFLLSYTTKEIIVSLLKRAKITIIGKTKTKQNNCQTASKEPKSKKKGQSPFWNSEQSKMPLRLERDWQPEVQSEQSDLDITRIY